MPRPSKVAGCGDWLTESEKSFGMRMLGICLSCPSSWGKTALVYVQISKDTFVELQPAHAQRPPGINHFGVLVQDMAATTAALTDLGAAVGDTRIGSTKAVLANVSAPNGIRIELLELPPESLTAEAIARWQ